MEKNIPVLEKIKDNEVYLVKDMVKVTVFHKQDILQDDMNLTCSGFGDVCSEIFNEILKPVLEILLLRRHLPD